MRIITGSDRSTRRIAAVGMYDGVHLGHKFLIEYLRLEAASRGLTPAVITFSRHPLSLLRPLESPGLLTPLDDRLRLLGQAGADDVIMLTFNDSLRRKTAREFLNMLRQSYGIETLVLGFNNRFGHDRPDAFDDYKALGAEIGIEVIAAPEYCGAGAPVSSSVIRHHLLSGKPEKAAESLGQPYRLRGIVTHGQSLGRTIGFPTANVEPTDKDSLIPKAGAYAAFVTTPDGVRRPAMVNIGFRPTVSDPDAPGRLSIEANIFDFIGYLYDEEVTVEFIRFLRDEKRFPSVEKLTEQLRADAAKARKTLTRS